MPPPPIPPALLPPPAPPWIRMQGLDAPFAAIGQLWSGKEKDADWSDLLHPCAFLEVRRGMRTLLFLMSFIGLHTLLSLAVVCTLLGPWELGVHGHYVAFWWVAAIFFLFVLPARSVAAVRGDWDRGAVELLVFTRTGPHGVVNGKWLAYAMEIALLACTLTPYLVLHYYGNGSNPLYEVGILWCLALASGSLCAFGVTISTIPSLQGRVIATVATVFLWPWVVSQMMGFGIMAIFFLIGALDMMNVRNYIPAILLIIVIIAIAVGGSFAFAWMFIMLPLRIGTQWVEERTRGYLRA